MSNHNPHKILKARSNVRNLAISSKAKAVLLALLERANGKRYAQVGRAECFPGRELIATDTSLSVRTVFRALQELQAAGLISLVHRLSDKREWSSNLYTIQLDAILIGAVGHADTTRGPKQHDSVGHADTTRRPTRPANSRSELSKGTIEFNSLERKKTLEPTNLPKPPIPPHPSQVNGGVFLESESSDPLRGPNWPTESRRVKKVQATCQHVEPENGEQCKNTWEVYAANLPFEKYCPQIHRLVHRQAEQKERQRQHRQKIATNY